MSNFSHIIFDLDGTLTDNTIGIGNSLRYSMEKMQLDNYSEELLQKFIGPPLQQCFKTYLGLSEKNIELAVMYFREYYGSQGWSENIPYAGVLELLESIYFAGKKIYIATSKLEKFAIQIMKHFEFDKYLEDIQGADYGGKHTKAGLIDQLMTRNGIQNLNDVVMIGDTKFDIIGAKECEIQSVAIGYGFGNKDELLSLNPDFFVDDPEELFDLLV